MSHSFLFYVGLLFLNPYCPREIYIGNGQTLMKKGSVRRFGGDNPAHRISPSVLENTELIFSKSIVGTDRKEQVVCSSESCCFRCRGNRMGLGCFRLKDLPEDRNDPGSTNEIQKVPLQIHSII